MAGPFPWMLADGVTLAPLAAADAAEFHAVITANQPHLDRWLRWSSTITGEPEAAAYLAHFATTGGMHLGLRVRGALVGGIVCWYIHRQNRNAEVGYWLAETAVGGGLVTRGVERMLAHLFEEQGLHRIEMQCAVENVKSRAIPERFGFRNEGVRRDSHWITTRFLDHVVYGLLEGEWKAREPRAESR